MNRSRSLVRGVVEWSLPAGWVVGVFVLVVVLGRGDPHPSVALAATAVVAVSFDAVRRGAGALATRLTGAPVATRRALTQLMSRFDVAEGALGELAGALRHALRADDVSVWLLVGGTLRCAATASGDDPGRAGETVLLRYGDDILGELRIHTDRSLRRGERRLAEDLASVGSLLVRNMRLRSELGARVDEVTQASDELVLARRRLVDAHDAERRAIERDIHDGAQQALTAVGVRVGLASRLAERDPGRAPGAIADARSLVREAQRSITELVQRVYPTELSQDSAAAAIERLASWMPFALEVSATARRQSPDVEACVYFTCLEALQNSAKHASAANAHVRIDEHGGCLRFAVTDDGSGFDVVASAGTGIRNMVDRVTALRGTLEIVSALGAGTSVRGSVPAGS